MDGWVETGEEIVMSLKQTGISIDDKYAIDVMEDALKSVVKALQEMRITPARRIRRAYAMGMWAGMRIAAKQTQANLAAMKEAEKKPNIIETEN
jgi:sulfopyruvate decarboxylase TPP-binding subunit